MPYVTKHDLPAVRRAAFAWNECLITVAQLKEYHGMQLSALRYACARHNIPLNPRKLKEYPLPRDKRPKGERTRIRDQRTTGTYVKTKDTVLIPLQPHQAQIIITESTASRITYTKELVQEAAAAWNSGKVNTTTLIPTFGISHSTLRYACSRYDIPMRGRNTKTRDKDIAKGEQARCAAVNANARKVIETMHPKPVRLKTLHQGPKIHGNRMAPKCDLPAHW